MFALNHSLHILIYARSENEPETLECVHSVGEQSSAVLVDRVYSQKYGKPLQVSKWPKHNFHPNDGQRRFEME